jgi:transcriptional regulator with XRE-family HTH domain
MDAKELGRQVLARRKEKNISQTELADFADISRNYVSLIERGEATNISIKVINQLAIALGATSAELTGASTMVMIPPALREFAMTSNLPYDIIDRLVHIPRRGKEPKTSEEWKELYNVISNYIDMGNE